MKGREAALAPTVWLVALVLAMAWPVAASAADRAESQGLRVLGSEEMRASVGGGVKYGHTCGWITPQHCALLACSPVPNNKCEHICVVFGFQICRESASSMCSYSSYKCCVKRYCEPIDADCQNANDCNGLYTRCYTPSDCSAQFETKCGDPTPSGQCGP